MPSGFPILTQYGTTICVPDIFTLTHYVLFEQERWFEDEPTFVAKCVRPGDVAIDIGANFGIYSTILARAVGPTGRLVAFEPGKNTAALLAETLGHNRFTQAEVVPAAVSEQAGTGTLKLGSGPELSALISTPPPSGASVEQVQLVTLDDFARERGLTRLDFLKIDAESHETQIGRGARQLLTAQSPLVMFEVNAGKTFDFSLLEFLESLGYVGYRLLPGMDLLVRYDLGMPLDADQLNLFACKPDRADLLHRAGWLAHERLDSAKAPAPDLDALPACLATQACSRQAPEVRPGSFATALAHYFAARAHGASPDDRAQHLAAAGAHISRALAENHSVARVLSYVRIAASLGLRKVAAQALAPWVAPALSGVGLPLDEGFLAPTARLENVPPVAGFDPWSRYAILEAEEQLRAFSVAFTGTSFLERAPVLSVSPHYSPEMERRRQLVRLRSQQQHRREPHPLLIEFTPENLNPWFWNDTV